MNQYVGDFIVTNMAAIRNDVTGVTQVKRGGKLASKGRLSGGLIIEAGGMAVISGEVSRNIVNDGHLVLNGRVAGKLLGKGAVVVGTNAHVSGDDLPVKAAPENPGK